MELFLYCHPRAQHRLIVVADTQAMANMKFAHYLYYHDQLPSINEWQAPFILGKVENDIYSLPFVIDNQRI